MCYLRNCRYHTKLIEDIKNCYKKCMPSVSTSNTCTVCLQFSSTDWVAKLLSRVDTSLIMCRGQFVLTTRAEEWTDCPASRKRDSWRKSTKNTSLQKTKLTQIANSVLTDRIEQNQKTKFDLKLMKIVDCFVDGHGNYTSKLVSFQIKSL